jgi:hypothetical protein
VDKPQTIVLDPELRAALERLASDWVNDADFFEAGDEVRNRPRVVMRSRKATPMEMAAETARQCAYQLRKVLADTE